MRKLMSMLLALCLVLAMVPIAASAEGTDNITVTGLSGFTTESFGTLAEALQAVNSDSWSETAAGSTAWARTSPPAPTRLRLMISLRSPEIM